MDRDVISPRQVWVLLFVALLGPAELLPNLTAALAGRGAWCAMVLAFPVLLAEGWLVGRLSKDGGLAKGTLHRLGPVVGRGVLLLYIMYGLFLLALYARLAGERLLWAGYRGGRLPLFLLVLLGFALWMGRRKVSAFGRAVEIFFYALVIVLGVVVIFSLIDGRVERVWPVEGSELPAALAAALAPVGTLSVGVYAGCLLGRMKGEQKAGRQGIRWLAALCLCLAAIQVAVLAQLGPTLTGWLEHPFFEVARGVGVGGVFRRMESVTVAVWVLADLALLGLLTFSLRDLGEGLHSGWGKAMPWIGTVAAFAAAMWAFPENSPAARQIAQTWVPLINFILAGPLPLLILLIGRMRKKGKGTSCGKNGEKVEDIVDP